MTKQSNQNLLLRFYGLRRSGNHTISGWLRKNLPYNDLTIDKLHNDVWAPDYQVPRIIPPQEMQVEAPNGESSMLIVSYEDVPIPHIPYVSIRQDDAVLCDARIRDVIVIRDPFNMAASRLESKRKYGENDAVSRVPLVVAMHRWKDYAKEFIRIRDGHSSIFRDPVIINYCDWKLHKSTRDTLLKDYFGVDENFDLGLDDVSPEGHGSTRDGMNYQGRGSQMKTNERWKYFAYDPEYRKIFRDMEIVELSNRIFGQIPGTELLWNNYLDLEGAHRNAERI